MNLFKRVALGGILCACVLLNNTKASITPMKSQMSEIQTAVNKKLSNILPEGSLWEAHIPAFTRNNHEKINDLEVKIPNSFRSDKIIAKVWLDTDHGKKLYAVPVKIKSLGEANNNIKLSYGY